MASRTADSRLSSARGGTRGRDARWRCNGSRQIAAPREVVWAALNDPEVLKAAIPGCQELTGSPEQGFEATVKQKVGPVSATFHGRVPLADVVPLSGYTISGEGKGGAAGFAKGVRRGGAWPTPRAARS